MVSLIRYNTPVISSASMVLIRGQKLRLQFQRPFGNIPHPFLIGRQDAVAFIRQPSSALIGATLEGFYNLFVKHFVDFSGQSRGARIAHLHLLSRCGYRTKLRDICHQFGFTTAKTNSTWGDHFKAKFQLFTHCRANTMLCGSEQ